MSNNVTPTATESGVIHEATTEQVIATHGQYAGKTIDKNDSITWLIDGETAIAHNCDMGHVGAMFEENFYPYHELIYCSRGTYALQNIPRINAIKLYNDHVIHNCDEDLVFYTQYTNRAFLMEDRASDRIVLTYEGQDGECEEYEYESKCTRIYTEDSYFWVHDSHSGIYIYSSDTAQYYLDSECAEANGLMYDSDEDEWVSENTYHSRYNEDGWSNEHNTGSYHSFSRLSRKDEKHCGFSIGFEVEKEDRKVKVDVNHYELYNELGWCKEQDGSLDTKSGFEAVSPIYSLFGKQFDIDCKDSRLEKILNAEYNDDSCGGHINLSSDTFTRHQLYEGVSAFFPLLYCLYEKRMNETYCTAKKKNRMSAESDKYSAVYIRDNRIEIRIFAAVKSMENLKWRRDLVRIMVKNINTTELQVFKMMMNKKSKLYRHLLKVMTAEKIHEKCIKFLEYSKAFNDKNIDGHGNNLLNK